MPAKYATDLLPGDEIHSIRDDDTIGPVETVTSVTREPARQVDDPFDGQRWISAVRITARRYADDTEIEYVVGPGTRYEISP